MSVAYGESLSNLLQPFYLLLVLPVMGAGIKLQARELARSIPTGNECGICKSKDNLQKHHWRYDKPLLVSTMCSECHTIQHIKNRTENICLEVVSRNGMLLRYIKYKQTLNICKEAVKQNKYAIQYVNKRFIFHKVSLVFEAV